MPDSSSGDGSLHIIFYSFPYIRYVIVIILFFLCVIVRFEKKTKLEVVAHDDYAIRAILKQTLDYIFYNL